jgi:hypothetical protein
MNYIGGQAENGGSSARDEETAEGARQLVFYTSRVDLIFSATPSGIATRSRRIPVTASDQILRISRATCFIFGAGARSPRLVHRSMPSCVAAQSLFSISSRFLDARMRRRNERTCLSRQLRPWEVPDPVCETMPRARGCSLLPQVNQDHRGGADKKESPPRSGDFGGSRRIAATTAPCDSFSL